MNTGQLRKAIYNKEEVHFHHWVKKVADYETKEEATKAIIEYTDGKIEEVWGENIRFVDTPEEDKRAHLRCVDYLTKGKEEGTGFFHQWLTIKDSIGSEYVVALIEDEEGDMLHVDMFEGKIKFQNL